jgi:MFS family permease
VGWSVAPERVGTSAYGALLRDRGLRRLLAGSQAGRLGTSMLPLSLVLFGTQAAGSPGAGGAALAGFLITGAFHPARARLVDRGGGRAMARFVVAFAALLAAVAALGSVVSAPAPLIVAAAIAGAFAPPLGPYTRAALGATLRGRPDDLQRAYALDSAAEEASLVLGPLLVGGIAAVWTDAAALLLAAGLVLAGGLATARSSPAHAITRRADAAAEPSAPMPRRAWAVIACLGTVGVALGAIDVGVPAITRAAGVPAAAGILLAAMAVGTALAGLLAGLRSWRHPPLMRIALLLPPLALALAACALVHQLAALAVLLAVPGAIVGIILVSAYVALDELAPPGAATRTFAWLITANNGGLALGAALAGVIADSSPHAALWVAPVAAVPGCALAAASVRRRPAPR